VGSKEKMLLKKKMLFDEEYNFFNSLNIFRQFFWFSQRIEKIFLFSNLRVLKNSNELKEDVKLIVKLLIILIY
jgi:hypothetical protein